MIDIKKLTKKDIGHWVKYTRPYSLTREKGKIKSWNNKYIFVVYKCANNWDNYQSYTGIATNPKDLEYLFEGIKEDRKFIGDK
jgi:hypothetical protein